jgi:hypothetical protein
MNTANWIVSNTDLSCEQCETMSVQGTLYIHVEVTTCGSHTIYPGHKVSSSLQMGWPQISGLCLSTKKRSSPMCIRKGKFQCNDYGNSMDTYRNLGIVEMMAMIVPTITAS